MQFIFPHPTGQIRQLAPFVFLALSLHVILLSALHPPTSNSFVMSRHPMEVYFSASPISEQLPIPVKAPTGKHGNSAYFLATPMTQATTLVSQPDAPPADTTFVFDSQQLMESAKSIARDEAQKTEQHIETLEKQKLNTPIASLEQYLRQPHKEIRLANGTLKIITDAGAVCFQPVPEFARNMPGLFGIPTTCP